MTWEKYQDLYREAWRIQAKKDKDANPALRFPETNEECYVKQSRCIQRWQK